MMGNTIDNLHLGKNTSLGKPYFGKPYKKIDMNPFDNLRLIPLTESKPEIDQDVIVWNKKINQLVSAKYIKQSVYRNHDISNGVLGEATVEFVFKVEKYPDSLDRSITSHWVSEDITHWMPATIDSVAKNPLTKEQEVLSKLPKLRETNLFNVDSTVKAFYELLLRTENPYHIIDEMFVHYAKLTNEQFDEIKKLRESKSVVYELKFNSEEERKSFIELVAKKGTDPKHLGIPNLCFSLSSKDDEREEKFSKQRIERGFDESETWALKETITKFILPRLKEYRLIIEDTIVNRNEFFESVDKAIRAFEITKLDSEGETVTPEMWKEYEEGMSAFGRIYMGLWW